MPAHSKEVINTFCELCDWLLQIWQTRKYLFDENPNEAALKTPRHAHFFYRLQVVLQEAWLHQLAKLHDPAVQGGSNGHINLSLNYIIEYGQWDHVTKTTLTDLLAEMSTLAKPIKDARNKVLSHNDLAVLLNATELGSFDAGADEIYFRKLHKFASLVSQTVLGEPFVFDDLVQNDVDAFMKTFLLGTRI
ncbi:MAG: hypothetical protein H6R19_1661 [Proteobacteria bacterium]|nr:hypothetical protein [Pseudomonadota bacterium]